MSEFASSKVKAFFLEFPFLNQLPEKDKIGSVAVKRWDSEMLNKHPAYFGTQGGLIERNMLYLLDDNRELVAVVGESQQWSLWKPLSWFGYPKTYESFYASVARLPERDLVMVTLAVGHSCSKYSHHEVVVWKAPNGCKHLQEWLTKEVAKEREMLTS